MRKLRLSFFSLLTVAGKKETSLLKPVPALPFTEPLERVFFFLGFFSLQQILHGCPQQRLHRLSAFPRSHSVFPRGPLLCLVWFTPVIHRQR